MRDVFNRIIRSRPNTFVTFSTAPVSSGISPIPHSATSLSYKTAHVLPGELSSVAHGTGSITFNGRVCRSPMDGGTGSIEIIRTPSPDAYQSASETVINIPGVGTVVRVSSSSITSNPAEYTASGPGWSVSNKDGAGVGVEHVVLNINGDSVSLIVNGERATVDIDDISSITDISSVQVFPASGFLWGVSLRPTTLPEEYIEDIVTLINSFPTPAEADAQFEPDSFYFDKSMLNSSVVTSMEDIDFESDPRRAQMYSGSDASISHLTTDQELVTGMLQAINIESVGNVMAECKGLSCELVGDAETDTTPRRIVLDHRSSSPLTSLNKATVGEPSRVSISVDDSEEESVEIDMNLYMLPSVTQVRCESTPDRVATIPVGSALVGWTGSSLFSGGLWGNAFIEPDTNALDSTEYPVAYGIWVLVSRAGSLLKSSSFNVSLNASLQIVSTGISSVYLDGVSYTASSAVPKGWHFISIIPTAKSNVRIEVGEVGASKSIIRSFSSYLTPSPASYMNTAYRNYVDPPSIKTTNTDTLSIVEVSNSVYEHDWSISAAD